MRKTYHTLVEFNNSIPPIIKKISVPDLDIELSEKEIAENKLEQICPEMTKFIEQRIEKRIKDIHRANQIIPEPQFDVTKWRDKNQIVLEITVNAEEVKKSFFAKFLPGSGLTLNVGAALSGIIINVVQMQLAMGSDQTSKSDVALAILESVLNSSIGILFYIYLKSGQGLEKIGVKLDDFLAGKKLAFDINQDSVTFPRNRCRSTGFILMHLLMAGTAIGLQFGNAAAQIGGLNAIEDEANQSGNSFISAYNFNIAKWIATTCGNTVGLIMTGMILKQLSHDIQNWVNQREILKMTKALTKSREEDNSDDAQELKEIHAEAVAAFNKTAGEHKEADNPQSDVNDDVDIDQTAPVEITVSC